MTSQLPPTLHEIEAALRERGLLSRGAFHPEDVDEVPSARDGVATRTVVMAGQVGASCWATFSRERRDERDPLDRWSASVLGEVAQRFGARVLLPGEGPPYLPFQRWAQRGEPVHVSPLGLLIHPDYGLWHAYRGALAFAARIDLPPPNRRPSPCATCSARPCLSACPVAAFREGRFDDAACAAHLGSGRGDGCFAAGCLARAACPVGVAHRHPPEVARFHLEAFLAARSRSD